MSGPLPTITQPLALHGPGARRLRIHGNASTQILRSNAASWSLSGLELRSGLATAPACGGAINVFRGGAVLDEMQLSFNNSTASGGGICIDQADLRIDRSTISNSEAVSDGGAIRQTLVDGNRLQISNSSFSGNRAQVGGAIYLQGSDVVSTTQEITSNSFVGNTATSASSAGAFDLRGSSGVAPPLLEVELRNNLFATNTPRHLETFDGWPGEPVRFNSLGFNLGDTALNMQGALPSDQIVANARVGALANHGGPTDTHALLASSPAIDRGHRSGFTTDQLGQTRPLDRIGIANAVGGDGSDIGAVEDHPLFENAQPWMAGPGHCSRDGTCCANHRIF